MGGPCPEGPGPDGTCAQRRPPCAPHPTLRAVRGRFALLAFGLALALVVALSSGVRIDSIGINMIDPGPLFGAHAGFAPGGNCATCHTAHGAGSVAWLDAFLGGNDMSGQCITCHAFEGDPLLAHNRAFEQRPDLGPIACNQCHREHDGVGATLTRLTNEQCANCHSDGFATFPTDHPAFPAKFPHFQESAIKFDHVSHVKVHFEDPKVADRAPTSCADCHDVVSADNAVLPMGFAETCDGCHGTQIAQRDMVVLRLPVFDANGFDRDAVRDACGPTLDEIERLEEAMAAMAAGKEPAEQGAEETEYESVSSDEPTPVSSYLLEVAGDDTESYSTPMQDLVMAMAEEGTAPLASLVDDRLGEGMAAKLFAGLNPDVAKRLACAWAANQEYELPADPEMGGWFGDYLELRYQPTGHADPVVKAWIETALLIAADGDANAIALRDGVIDAKEGPGACIKCHAVTAAGDAAALTVDWRFRAAVDRPYDHYSHRAHLSLVQAGSTAMESTSMGCRFCHRLDDNAPFAASFDDFDPSTFAANFKGIQAETCAQCHIEGEVRQDCQLCHRYHLPATFKPSMMGADLYQE